MAKPVYKAEKFQLNILIPWIETISTRVEKRITTAVKNCYFAAKPSVVFTTQQLLPITKKTWYLSIIAAIYQFCATVIVGTLVALPNACESILNNTFTSPSLIFCLSKPRQSSLLLQS